MLSNVNTEKQFKKYLKVLRKQFDTELKAVSFLPLSEHGYKQAPYEEITKEEYEVLMKNTTPITSGNFNLEMDYSGECANGVCPIR